MNTNFPHNTFWCRSAPSLNFRAIHINMQFHHKAHRGKEAEKRSQDPMTASVFLKGFFFFPSSACVWLDVYFVRRQLCIGLYVGKHTRVLVVRIIHCLRRCIVSLCYLGNCAIREIFIIKCKLRSVLNVHPLLGRFCVSRTVIHLVTFDWLTWVLNGVEEISMCDSSWDDPVQSIGC